MSKANLRKEEIVHAAILLMKEKSYRGTTLQDIARQLNITEPALYYYFPSKERLLAEIFDRSIDMNINKLVEIKEQHISAEKKIRAVIRMYVELVASSDMMTVFFNNKGELSEESREEITVKERKFVAILNSIIQEGFDQGVLKTSNLTLASFSLLGMCSWIYKWYNPKGSITMEQVADSFADIYLNGLKQQ